ncbi:MAG: hypothetical protein JNM07_05500 [Phycisphaerae bacterium]|nr:hypothetical protein [Phycisphaerae bacterium]
MNQTELRPLVARVLGARAALGGRHELLGIAPGSWTAEQIEAARDRQLSRVSIQTGLTADEQYALQSLLHRVCDDLLGRGSAPLAGSRSEQPVRGGARPKGPAVVRDRPGSAPAPDSRSDPAAALLRRVLLGAAGACVVLIIALTGLLVYISTHPSAARGVGTPGTPAPGVSPDSLLTTIPSPASQPLPPTVPEHAATPTIVAQRDTPATHPDTSALNANDPEGAVRVLQMAAQSVPSRTDQARSRFGQAAPIIGRTWVRLDPARRQAASESIVEFFHQLANIESSSAAEATSAALETIIADASRFGASGGVPADDLWSGVWATGVLARLSRERDLPASVRNEVERGLAAALASAAPGVASVGTLNGGVLAALARAPARLAVAAGEGAVPPVALARWIEAVRAALPDEGDPRRELLLIDGLELQLISSRPALMSHTSLDLVRPFVLEVRWRKGGPARARMLEWFRDPRVSRSALAAVTRVLANESSAEGVDATMVLSGAEADDSGASASDRVRLREAYSVAWGLNRPEEAARVAEEFLAVAREIMRGETGKSDVAELTHAAALARLCAAARRRWDGDSTAASTAIADAKRIMGTAVASPSSPSQAGSSGEWALRLVTGEPSLAARLSRLKEADRLAPGVGPIDAEVLAEAACFGQPPELRAAAQTIVRKMASEPWVVNAMLELLPRVARTDSVSDTIASVAERPIGSVAEPGWEMRARRALVERLVELVAQSGSGASIDALSDSLAQSYRICSGASPTNDSGAPEDGPARLLLAAEALWAQWRHEAERHGGADLERGPYGLSRIDRRRDGRLSMATGPVLMFAANQASIAEMMALVVASEMPARADRVGEAVTRMQAARRTARHVFSQIRATEQCMLELWMLRLGETVP